MRHKRHASLATMRHYGQRRATTAPICYRRNLRLQTVYKSCHGIQTICFVWQNVSTALRNLVENPLAERHLADSVKERLVE